MEKLKVNIVITKNGNQGFICSCDYPFKEFDLGGSGDSVEDAKADCFTFYDEMRKEYPEDNLPDLEVEWAYDLPSFFDRFDFLNVTKVARYAGMSPSNFRHYVAGSKPVTQAQLTKIKQAIEKMTDEMRASSLTMSVS
ncbi:hypothetical protein [uncultured Dysgonomonas sp.]|uniref:hypothetical protein n=1 Tax=uncultured Dysgonomonas sp. TaxID=206096 RepID=UPI0026133542|nr:hypothetical protein [uncultured Dysgonomonas sp.]